MIEHPAYLTEFSHFDLQEITEKRVSLNDMAKLLGCKLKSSTGQDAIKLWEQGKYKELKEYCMNDVDVTEEVYLKYKALQTEEKMK